MSTEPAVYQKFYSEDGKQQLASLPTHIFKESGKRYVLWSDIQLAFKNIDSVTKRNLSRKHSDNAYHAVLSNEQVYEAERSHSMQLMKCQIPNAIADQQTKAYHGDIHDPPNNESVVHLSYLLRSFKALNGELLTDLGSWDDSNPRTHSFRLYFLCDNRKEGGAPGVTPQPLHLSNHAGYNIKQPQEFFQAYGDYVLSVLQMVEYGYLDSYYNVPPLNTFEILSGCDTAGTGGRLCKDTIRSLVAKSIAYLLDLSLPKWIKKPALSQDQSAMIKTYLDIPDGTTAEGNLQKYLGLQPWQQHVYWRCQEHAHQYLDPRILDELKEFVESHGGVIDIQQSTVQVELLSPMDAD
ncbi:hypothetical protein BG006_004650 [Podila minutissima]|uniref:Uncharacterized protein n=1 Tax=Podila minutissima TaxID=64525 RepID=A0A9P5SLH2_9FUNG|nr:hypothetical protein BG006_004650 [Podila minutissima]